MKLEMLQSTRVSTHSIRFMLEVLAAEGCDPGTALHRAGLPASILEDPLAQISGLDELGFQQVFVELTAGRQDLWFRTGQNYRVMGYGVAGLGLMTSQNLSHAVSNGVHWQPLFYTLGRFIPKLSHDGVALAVEFDLSDVPPLLREFTLWRDLGAVQCAYGEITEGFAFSRVTLASPRPAVPLTGLTGETVFDAPRSQLHWSREMALQPFLYAEPALHAGYARQCADLIRAIESAPSFLNAVICVVARDDSERTLEMTARELGMSKRTLQRRLQDHGLTYHDVQGSVRARRARDLLQEERLSIAEVAWQMGYADSSGFTHAFRRWTGFSPRDYRNRGGDAGRDL